MRKNLSLELRIGVDVGCCSHNVAIGLSTGEILEEFAISHEPEGFRQFFSRIEKHERKLGYPVAVAMEGYNGYARPLDTLVRARDWRLFNINNLKLARFKEIFPGAAKTDDIDARKALGKQAEGQVLKCKFSSRKVLKSDFSRPDPLPLCDPLFLCLCVDGHVPA